MSWVEDYGCFDYDEESVYLNGTVLQEDDFIFYYYKNISKETEKAYLINFDNFQAWVPKACILEINKSGVRIACTFNFKPINEIKTIGIGDIC